MIPLYLKICGFLSYQDPVALDFTSFDLACVAGANGAGKSSLLDAITWALFGKARKQDDSLINTHAKVAEIVLVFSYEGNIYRVQRVKEREKTTLLEFQIYQVGLDLPEKERIYSAVQETTPGVVWKTLSGSGLRETDARIRETLRLDYDTFVNASFFLQGKADQFTQQSPGDRKRILSSILGLDVWERYRQEAAERRRLVEQEIASIDGQLREINAELDEEPQRKSRLKQLEGDLKRLAGERANQEALLANVQRLQASFEERKKSLDILRQRLDEDRQQLGLDQQRLLERCTERDAYQQDLEQAEEITQAYQAWQAQRLELQAFDEIAERFREQEKRRNAPREQIQASQARLEQELHMLRSQAAEIAELDQKMAQIADQLQQVRQKKDASCKALEQREQLENQLEQLRQAQPAIKAENLHLKQEMDELKARIDQLREAAGATCPVCGQPLSQAERQVLVESLQAEGEQMGKRYRANQALLNENQARLRDLEAQKPGLNALEGEYRSALQLESHLSSQLEAAESRRQEWENNGHPRMQVLETDLVQGNYALEARAQLAEIDEQLRAIGYDPLQHDQVRKAELAGRAWEERQRSLEKAQAAMAPLLREIERLQSQVAGLEKKVTRQQADVEQMLAALAAEQALIPDLQALEQEVRALQESENHLRQEVGAAQQKVNVLDDLRVRKKSYTAQREELARQVGLYKQLERAFSKDGVPALLIEQALPQIETKSNEVLDRLSGGNMSVRFITQAAYKDKGRSDLKETLDIQISDSAGTRDYEMFSGGEAFRVNFAIRLALAEVLAQRAGARLQTLVIDEGFGSQDAQGRQRLVEAINLVRSDFAKILVVTHIDELKDAFPNRIEVEKTERGSNLRVV